MLLKRLIAVSVGLGLSSFVWANEAPVVDVQQDAANTQAESVGQDWQPMTDAAKEEAADAKHMQLSQQVANLTQMNLPQQIADLRQKISQLQGELDLAERDLKIVSSQQARFYQDLSSRIDRMKAGGSPHMAAAPMHSTAGTQQFSDATMYQKAFKLLAKKQFPLAKNAFSAYLKTYSQGKFASNAYYWLGEIAMHDKDLKTAFSRFQTVIAQYPKSEKAPDAKLKVAMIHAKTGKKAIAKIELQQIKKSYPGSTAAQLAGLQLGQL